MIFLLLKVVILVRYKSGFICMPFCPCLKVSSIIYLGMTNYLSRHDQSCNVSFSVGLPAERRNMLQRAV